MINCLRTNSQHPDFNMLVAYLDAELAERDGKDHAFYSQFNSVAAIRHVIVAYQDNKPVGCGAIKEFEPGTMEVKRMFVPVAHRGKGIASAVLASLEEWAADMNYAKCVLETGKRQPEAIALYEKNGYRITPNYGQYVNVENSVCFEKKLRS